MLESQLSDSINQAAHVLKESCELVKTMLRTGWAPGLQLTDRPGMEIAAILTHRKEEQKRVKEQFLIYTFLDYTCYIDTYIG